MTIDDRLRSAYKRELEQAVAAQASASAPPDSTTDLVAAIGGDPARRMSSRPSRVLALAAGLIMLFGVFAAVNLRSNGAEGDRELMTATAPPLSESSGGGGGVGDGASPGATVDPNAVDVTLPSSTATPTPSPVPTSRPTPTVAPARGDRASVSAVPTPTPAEDTGDNGDSAADLGNDTDADASLGPDQPDDSAQQQVVTPDPTATLDAAPPAATSVATSPTPTSTPAPTSSPVPTASATPIPTATPAPTATATAVPTPTPEPFDEGVLTATCPNGRRAQLELASLAYSSANTGWGRLFNLVDEQDGPYYFLAWEPGYELAVTVEITLQEPALASDIRVHQDPYTPVAGAIGVTASGVAIEIPLSGVDGWRVHDFSPPIELRSFTITRDASTENIMEVVVCLAP